MKYWILFLLCLICISCAELARDYARHVYDYQHSVLIRLMNAELYTDQNNMTSEKIWKLEEDLNGICQPLQEAGRRRMANEEITEDLKYQISTSLFACENKTIEIDNQLRKKGL